MGQVFDTLTPELRDWIARQHLFFVATAPLAADGRVNASPKGLDTLRVTGDREVAWLDLTGSGVETVAHLRENGRIVLMFCAFEGPPRIVRLHGRGDVVWPTDPAWDELVRRFPDLPGARSIVRVAVDRVSDSCGYAVPKLAFVEERDTLRRWAERKGDDGLASYRHTRNAESLDGLPGVPCPEPAQESPPTGALRLRRLTRPTEQELRGLAEVLIDCVHGGASVGFLQPLPVERALAWFRTVAAEVRRGARALVVAEDELGVVGTVQLVLAQPENQPHRAELVKMLVHRRGRRKGLGERLVAEAEALARDHGRTLLVLDTASADAERLYARLGWQRYGAIPGYALLPDGTPCDTVGYYRNL